MKTNLLIFTLIAVPVLVAAMFREVRKDRAARREYMKSIGTK